MKFFLNMRTWCALKLGFFQKHFWLCHVKSGRGKWLDKFYCSFIYIQRIQQVKMAFEIHFRRKKSLQLNTNAAIILLSFFWNFRCKVTDFTSIRQIAANNFNSGDCANTTCLFSALTFCLHSFCTFWNSKE